MLLNIIHLNLYKIVSVYIFFASRNCVPKWREKFNFIWNFFFLSFHITHTHRRLSLVKSFSFPHLNFALPKYVPTIQERQEEKKDFVCLRLPLHLMDATLFIVFFFVFFLRKGQKGAYEAHKRYIHPTKYSHGQFIFHLKMNLKMRRNQIPTNY